MHGVSQLASVWSVVESPVCAPDEGAGGVPRRGRLTGLRSGHPQRAVVRRGGRLQRHGDRPAGALAGGPVQLLQPQVQPQDGAHAGGPAGAHATEGPGAPSSSSCRRAMPTARAAQLTRASCTSPVRARSSRAWSLCTRAASSTGTSSPTTSSWVRGALQVDVGRRQALRWRGRGSGCIGTGRPRSPPAHSEGGEGQQDSGSSGTVRSVGVCRRSTAC